MEERRQEYPSLLADINEVKKDVRMILKILNGNGVMGLVAKVLNFEIWKESISDAKLISKNRILDNVFKIAAGILLAYIAYKLQLK